MEGALEQGSVDIDPDFEPQSRPRSCTWPLPRPDLSIVKQEPQSEGTPVEEGRCDGQDAALSPQHDLESRNLPEGVPGLGSSTPRKGGSRRNAWGNQSYAELISQAIETSPEKRLTLSQIYEWMVKSVPFFKDKGDSNSSAGWKDETKVRLKMKTAEGRQGSVFGKAEACKDRQSREPRSNAIENSSPSDKEPKPFLDT